MNTLDAALDYAGRGWPVLPLHWPLPLGGCACGRPDCRTPGKHPRIANGVHGASVDPAQIREWWNRWPRANVGIATGAVSGVDVLDVDPRHGGEETLARLCQGRTLPDTVESLTGGGGRHLLFAHADVAWPKSLGPGLDVKADGGYIVAPPSLHLSGRRYVWELSSDPSDTPIAAWPDWLLALATPVATRRAPNMYRQPPGSAIPAGRWERVLAGCKRLRELETQQREHGLSYTDWLAAVSVARLGGADGAAWAVDLTESYAPGCSQDDLARLAEWLSGNLHGAATCVALGCHPGRCGFRPRSEGTAPSPLRHAWTRHLDVEVA